MRDDVDMIQMMHVGSLKTCDPGIVGWSIFILPPILGTPTADVGCLNM